MNKFNNPLLRIKDLSVEFSNTRNAGIFAKPSIFRAISDINLTVNYGEALGLIGESGSGKTTLGKAIMGLLATSNGEIKLESKGISTNKFSDRMSLAKQIQMVFQDPYSSLHPRQTIGQSLAEPFKIHKSVSKPEIPSKVRDLIKLVGLTEEHLVRYPQHFSGGQRQRIAIARAIANDPAMIIADEPVSALDVSVQAQILNLLEDLRQKRNLSMLFISHDLSVVKHLCQRIAVMYLGRIVELARVDQITSNPSHPYTAALLSAVPRVHKKNRLKNKPIVLSGDIPSHANIPSGCPFRARCWLYAKKGNPSCCRERQPSLEVLPDGAKSACFFPQEVTSGQLEFSKSQSQSLRTPSRLRLRSSVTR